MRKFLLYSNIHIPVIAASLLASTTVIQGVSLSIPLMIVASSGAFLVYQIDRIWLSSPEDAINQPARRHWHKENRSTNHVLLVIAVASSLIAAWWISRATLMLCLVVGFIGIVYLIPLGQGSFRLKGVWFGKPLLITICWAYGGVFLPVLEGGGNIDREVWSFFFYRALLVLANVMLTDLPDREGDLASHLKTMAVVFPQKVLIWLAIFFAGAAVALGLYHGRAFSWEPILFVDLLGAFIMLILAIRAYGEYSTNSHFIYGYIVDLIVAWPGVTVVCYYLFR